MCRRVVAWFKDGLTSSVRGFTGRSTLSLMANGNPNRMPVRSARRPIRPLYSTASTEISPSASSEASALNNGMSSAKSKVASSASSSTGTLTAGSGGDSVSVKPTGWCWCPPPWSRFCCALCFAILKWFLRVTVFSVELAKDSLLFLNSERLLFCSSIEVAMSDNKSSSQLTFCDDKWSSTKHREEFGKKLKKSPL